MDVILSQYVRVLFIAFVESNTVIVWKLIWWPCQVRLVFHVFIAKLISRGSLLKWTSWCFKSLLRTFAWMQNTSKTSKIRDIQHKRFCINCKLQTVDSGFFWIKIIQVSFWCWNSLDTLIKLSMTDWSLGCLLDHASLCSKPFHDEAAVTTSIGN